MTVKVNHRQAPSTNVVRGLNELGGMNTGVSDYDVLIHEGGIDKPETMLRARVSNRSVTYTGEINKKYNRISADDTFTDYLVDGTILLYIAGDITPKSVVKSILDNNYIVLNEDNITVNPIEGTELYDIVINDLTVYGSIKGKLTTPKIKLSSLLPNPTDGLLSKISEIGDAPATEEELVQKCIALSLEVNDIEGVIFTHPTADLNARSYVYIRVPEGHPKYETEYFTVWYDKLNLENAKNPTRRWVIWSQVNVTNNWYPDPTGLRRDLALTHNLSINPTRVLEFRSDSYSTTNKLVKLAKFISLIYVNTETTRYYTVYPKPVDISEKLVGDELDMFDK